MKIGLIAASCKPFHVGHWNLIKLASSDNDYVEVIVSLADRCKPGEFHIKGVDMELVWNECIMPNLPQNVKVSFVKVPIRHIYETLGFANEEKLTTKYSVYSDPIDIQRRFPMNSREKYFGWLHNNIGVEFVSVERTGKNDISGTRMREFLSTDNKKMFVQSLPNEIDGSRVWQILGGTTQLSVNVVGALDFVSDMMPNSEDWLAAKKQILLSLPPVDRKQFTTRDPKTKNHYPFNDFEKKVRSYWRDKTGKLLMMPANKMMEDAPADAYL